MTKLVGGGTGTGHIYVGLDTTSRPQTVLVGVSLDTSIPQKGTGPCPGDVYFDGLGGSLNSGTERVPLPLDSDGLDLQGSATKHSGDQYGIDDVTTTWSLTRHPDSDRDGFPDPGPGVNPDFADKCLSVYAAPPSTDGCPLTQPTKPECSDGMDNDGDKLVDFPQDPGCASAKGVTETGCKKPGYVRPEYSGGWRGEHEDVLYDVTVRWCEKKAGIVVLNKFADATELGSENWFIRAKRGFDAFGVGYELKWVPNAVAKPLVTALPGGGKRVVASTGAWKVCVDTLAPLNLIGGVRVLGEAAKAGAASNFFSRIPGMKTVLSFFKSGQPAVEKELTKAPKGWLAKARLKVDTAIDLYVAKLNKAYVAEHVDSKMLPLEQALSGPSFLGLLTKSERGLYDSKLSQLIRVKRGAVGRPLTTTELDQLRVQAKHDTTDLLRAQYRKLFEQKARDRTPRLTANIAALVELGNDAGQQIAGKLDLSGILKVCHTIWRPKIVVSLRPGQKALSYEAGTHTSHWDVTETH